MALYNDLRKRDIIWMCRTLLDQRVLIQRDVDGKLDIHDQTHAWNVPWHHVVQSVNFNCTLWSRIMFKHIFKQVPDSLLKGRVWVPSGCQNCWKVVMRPPNLRALFSTIDLEKKIGTDAKCGIEHRPFVFGNYGAYWYNRGQALGLEKYKQVREEVNNHPDLGPDVKVILKRSCTEMEMEAGPSDKWELSPEQIFIEDLVYQSFNIDNVMRKQSDAAIAYVHGRWIEYAYQWGDETVFEYLDPERPIYQPLVTYHHLAEEGEQKETEQ